MNRNRRKQMQRCAAIGLAGCMVFSNSVLAGAAQSGKEEVIYGVADTSGQMQNINVVNIFSSGSHVDYGNYTSVKMLNTADKITQDSDEISFSSDASRVYYQGTMNADTQLPWKIKITYLLDGQERSGEELAGAFGKIKIHISIKGNKSCKGSFYEDYALQVTGTLDTEKCSNIKAADATIANVGKQKQLSYTVLPGEGLDTWLSADVKDFEMDAFTINGVKLNLDIDIDDSELQTEIDKITDVTNTLNKGAKELADKGSSLKDGGNSVQQGSENLQKGSEQLDTGVKNIQDGISSVQQALIKMNAKSSSLTDGSADVLEALTTIQKSLSGVSSKADDIKKLTDASGKIKTSLNQLTKGSNDLSEKLGYDQYAAILKAKGLDVNALQTGNETAVKNLAQQIETLKTQQKALEQQTGHEQEVAALEAQIKSLEETQTLLSGNSAMFSGTRQYLDQMSDAAGQLSDGMTELNKQYQIFDKSLSQLTTELKKLTGQMTQLQQGVQKLVKNYKKLDKGISEYTEGVAKITAGYESLQKGSESLVSGSESLVDGMSELTKGTKELNQGISEYTSGASEVADGTQKFADETSGMDKKVEDKIDEMISSYQKSDTPTVSFVSEKNKDVSSVQFVLKTESIKAEDTVETTTETKNMTFLEKIKNLFSK